MSLTIPALFDLSGKTAIVTGSTRGIGRSIAEQLAIFGARVVISSRSVEDCERTVDEFRAKGLQAVAIACNVGQSNQQLRLVEKPYSIGGRSIF